MSEFSALAGAVVRNDEDCLADLISRGCRVVWEPDPFNQSTLHMGAEAGNPRILTSLLQAGGQAFIDSIAYDGRTPLGRAVKEGDPEAVRILLAHGADPNIRDIEDATNPPLSDAVEGGFEDIVSMLLAAGADPNSPGWLALTPLDRARRRAGQELDEQSRRIESLLAQGSKNRP